MLDYVLTRVSQPWHIGPLRPDTSLWWGPGLCTTGCLFSSIAGLYPLDTSSSHPPLPVTATNGSRHCVLLKTPEEFGRHLMEIIVL